MSWSRAANAGKYGLFRGKGVPFVCSQEQKKVTHLTLVCLFFPSVPHLNGNSPTAAPLDEVLVPRSCLIVRTSANQKLLLAYNVISPGSWLPGRDVSCIVLYSTFTPFPNCTWSSSHADTLTSTIWGQEVVQLELKVAESRLNALPPAKCALNTVELLATRGDKDKQDAYDPCPKNQLSICARKEASRAHQTHREPADSMTGAFLLLEQLYITMTKFFSGYPLRNSNLSGTNKRGKSARLKS